MHVMVQKATPGAEASGDDAKGANLKRAGRASGRPPAFVRDEVIDSAMQLFWSKGVDHVTLKDLEAAAGVDRSTLYNSFGGKFGLYGEAASRYVARTTEQIFAPLSDVEDGIEATAGMLERLGDTVRSGEFPAGCLIVNDLASPTIDGPAATAYYQALSAGVGRALNRAVDQGRLEGATAERLASVVVAGVIGANLTGRAIGPAEALASIDGLTETVRTAALSS
jgi:AcrR family transcriptional regulator